MLPVQAEEVETGHGGDAAAVLDTPLLVEDRRASWTAGAVLCSDEESLDDAIDRADARLYVAKETRRNAIDRDRHASTVRAWQPRRA